VRDLSAAYAVHFEDDLHQLVMRPDSVPFLLTRPPSAVEDVLDDAETTEIPASKSVPPHHPPAPVTTTELELPSVIVDLRELDGTSAPGAAWSTQEASADVEAERASDVDGLLATFLDGEIVELPPPAIERNARSRSHGVAVAVIAATMALGATVAGARVLHHTTAGLTLETALHLAR
jgi:hypothetical protein